VPDSDSPVRDPVEELAETFFERRRTGEPLTVEQFVGEHSAWAEQLTALLPMLMQLEEVAQDTAPPPAPAGVAAGRHLGQYRLVREIGRGGMGIVFEAEDEQLERRVAIKLLPPQAGLDGQMLERFEREASAAARLSHPGIVPVYGVGEADGLHYFAMEFVDGETLDAVLDRVREVGIGSEGNSSRSSATSSPSTYELSTAAGRDARSYFKRVVRLALEAVQALDHAHQQGVVHRDIKPGNLMLSRDGKLKITDFGLCHSEGAENLTRTHDVLGTLRYMAPEQLKGDTDARSDVCSLGLVLYEMLTLQRARPASDRFGLAREVAEGRVLLPRKIDRRIPKDLETIVLKAAEADPNLRYANAAAMARDLEAWLEDRPIQARRPSFAYLVGLAVRRNPTAAVAWLVLVAAIVVGVFFYTSSQRQWAEDERRQRELAEHRGYAASIAAAQGAMAAGWTDAARHHLETCPPELRGWEWHHLHTTLDRSARTLNVSDTVVWDTAIDPTGDVLVVADAAGRVTLRAWPGGEQLRVLAHPKRVRRVRFLDARRLLTCCDDGRLRIWDTQAASIETNVTAHKSQITGMALHEASGALVTTGVDGAVAVWRIDDLTLRYRIDVGVRTWPPTVAPNGERFAFGANDNLVRVLRLEDGREVAKLDFMASDPERRHYPTPVAFSADGKSLACADRKGRIHILDARSLEVRTVLLGWPDHPWRIAFLPRGRLVVARQGGHLRIWDVAGERIDAELPGHGHDVVGLAVANGGSTLLTGGEGKLRVWELPVEPIPRVLRGEYMWAPYGACALDANRLATGGFSGRIVVWDARSGSVLRRIEGKTRIGALTSAPDGAVVVAGQSDGRVVAWRVVDGQRLWKIEATKEPIDDVVFASDGSEILVAAGNRGALFLDPKTGRVLREVACRGEFLKAARYLAGDRSIVVSSGDGVVECHDAQTGSMIWQRETDWGRTYVAASPDGTLVACADFAGVIHLLDADSGRTLRDLRGHTSPLHWPAFTPDGTRLTSASRDGSLKLWDVETGRELLNLREHASWIFRTAIAPDGSWIAASASGGDVRVYRRD